MSRHFSVAAVGGLRPAIRAILALSLACSAVPADRKFKGPLPRSQLRRPGLMVSPRLPPPGQARQTRPPETACRPRLPLSHRRNPPFTPNPDLNPRAPTLPAASQTGGKHPKLRSQSRLDCCGGPPPICVPELMTN